MSSAQLLTAADSLGRCKEAYRILAESYQNIVALKANDIKEGAEAFSRMDFLLKEFQGVILGVFLLGTVALVLLAVSHWRLRRRWGAQIVRLNEAVDSLAPFHPDWQSQQARYRPAGNAVPRIRFSTPILVLVGLLWLAQVLMLL